MHQRPAAERLATWRAPVDDHEERRSRAGDLSRLRLAGPSAPGTARSVEEEGAEPHGVRDDADGRQDERQPRMHRSAILAVECRLAVTPWRRPRNARGPRPCVIRSPRDNGSLLEAGPAPAAGDAAVGLRGAGRMSGERSEAGRGARQLVEDEARYFLHQAASTPGLSAVRRAEGVWVEDVDGRRFMDFHGNSVHHLGYAHPKLIAALKAQLDELAFSPRRFTNEVAVALAERLTELAPPPLGKVLLAPAVN